MGVSLRDAINAKCKDCSYDPLDVGRWRQQVESCRVTDCPLHHVRPVSYLSELKRIDQITPLEIEVCYGT